MDEILEILEKDARSTPEEIARLLNRKPADVKKAIAKFEKDGVIAGYRAVINGALVRDQEHAVSALIEVKVTPQKDVGFDRVAERIYSFPEVHTCYLLSGTYDLLLVVRGRDLHAIARFVAEKLAPLEHVKGTSTHFMLKMYKEDGVVLKRPDEDERITISY